MAKRSKTTVFQRVQSLGLLDFIFDAKAIARTGCASTATLSTAPPTPADLGRVFELLEEKLDDFLDSFESEFN